MRVQVSYHDKQGDEKWHYLEFDEKEGMFYLVTETCSRMGETSEGRMPLHQANGGSGYIKAVAWIKENMMKSSS